MKSFHSFANGNKAIIGPSWDHPLYRLRVDCHGLRHRMSIRQVGVQRIPICTSFPSYIVRFQHDLCRPITHSTRHQVRRPSLHPMLKSPSQRSMTEHALQSMTQANDHIMNYPVESIVKSERAALGPSPNPRRLNHKTNLDNLLHYLDMNNHILSQKFKFKCLRSALYNVCGQDAEKVWTIYNAMAQHNVMHLMKEPYFIHLLNILKDARADYTPHMLQVAKDMQQLQQAPCTSVISNVSTRVLQGMARHHNAAEACELIRTMILQENWPTSYHYRLLAKSCKKTSDPRILDEVMTLLTQAVHQHNIVHDHQVYPIMISVLIRVYDMNAAVKFLKAMETEGQTHHTPLTNGSPLYDVYTYTSFITGLAGTGNTKDAESVLKEMMNQGIKPTNVTFTAMLEAFGRAGQFDEAMDLWRKHGVRRNRVDQIMTTSLLCNMIRHNRCDLARKLVAECEAVQPLNPRWMDDQFRAAMVWFKVKENVDQGQAYVDALYKQNKNLVNEVMVNHLVSAHGQRHDRTNIDKSFALHLQPNESTAPPSLRAYHHLMDALFDCGDMTTALSAFMDVRRYSAPDNAMIAMVIRGLVRNDQHEAAWRLFHDLKANHVNQHACTTILAAATRFNSSSRTQALPGILSMLDISGNAPSLTPDGIYHTFQQVRSLHSLNVYMYTTMIAYLAKHNLQRALQVFEDMCRQNIEPTIVTYNSLLLGCDIWRNAPAAVMVLKHMQNLRVKPDDYTWHFVSKVLKRSRIDTTELEKLVDLLDDQRLGNSLPNSSIIKT